MAYAGYNEAKKECNKRYLAKMSRIAFVVTPEEKKEIERRAQAEGKSVNQFLKDKAQTYSHRYPEKQGSRTAPDIFRRHHTQQVLPGKTNALQDPKIPTPQNDIRGHRIKHVDAAEQADQDQKARSNAPDHGCDT